MSRAVLKKKKKKKPYLSEFVPKAYPNQKVQGGMGVLMPEQFRGGVATGDHSPVLEEKPAYVAPNVYAGYDNLTQEDFVEMAENPTSTVYDSNYDTTNAVLSPEMQKLVNNYNKTPEEVAPKSYDEERYNETPMDATLAMADGALSDAPALMTKDEALGILQNPASSGESILNAQKAISGNFSVASELGSKGMTEEDANSTFQNPDATPEEVAKAIEVYKGKPVGSGRGDYGMPMPVLNGQVEEGFHKMSDGSIMPDSEMKEPLEDPYDEAPVLETNGDVPAKGKGILSTTTTASQDRMSSPVSGNARGSAMPFGKVGRNEMLMRMGAKMMAGSTRGYGAAMDAAFSEYGNIQDSNRQAETDAFKNQEATRLAEAKIQSQKDKAAANKKAMGMPSAVYKQAALTAITDIKGRLAGESSFNPFDNNTGLFGYAMSHVAGTDAHDTKNAIDTIEASIGFDRLQKMRDDSPTGGALGQVSNIELALLRQSLGSLKQSSSRAQFVKNLGSIETQYKKAVAAVEAQQREWYRMQGVDVPEPVTNTANPDNGGYSIKQKK